jgi:glyoxylase-like metal-dependent hydrolase (beta-lactamase superfamily II)
MTEETGPAVTWSATRDRGRLIAESLGNGVTRLSEEIVAPSERSYFYLVEGSGRDCLIDGGWGLVSKTEAMRLLSARPLVAIASHSHFDHIGLLHLAAERHGHEAEAATFASPGPQATQALPYLEGRAMLENGAALEPSSIVQQTCPLDRFVADGYRLDLGGRALTVFHTPGHSPGSLSILDDRSGFLFTADVVHDGHIYDDIPGADREALLLSHRRLAGVAFTLACPGHGAILRPDAVRDRIERYRRETGV